MLSSNQARQTIPRAKRIRILNGTAALAVAVALFAAPFDAPESYYHFADTRAMLGVPNFGDVASNLAFLATGALGLAWLWSAAGRARLTPRERAPFAIFFARRRRHHLRFGLLPSGAADTGRRPQTTGACCGTGCRSRWRLPPSSPGFIADRVSARAGAVALPLVIAFGVAATVYWYVTAWARRRTHLFSRPGLSGAGDPVDVLGCSPGA